MEKHGAIFDHIYQPMDLTQFTAWMAKPKNGAKQPDVALDDYDQLCRDGYIVDRTGTHPKRKERVAVKTKDQITFRDESYKEKEVALKQKPNKKATQEDVDLAMKGLSSNSGLQCGGSSSNSVAGSLGGLMSQEGRQRMNAPDCDDLERVALKSEDNDGGRKFEDW